MIKNYISYCLEIVSEITKGKLESPAALIELAESLKPSPFQSQEVPIRWAFRGQSQAYGTLVPSFQRIFREKRYAGAAEMMERDLYKDISDTLRKAKGSNSRYAATLSNWRVI